VQFYNTGADSFGAFNPAGAPLDYGDTHRIVANSSNGTSYLLTRL